MQADAGHDAVLAREPVGDLRLVAPGRLHGDGGEAPLGSAVPHDAQDPDRLELGEPVE